MIVINSRKVTSSAVSEIFASVFKLLLPPPFLLDDSSLAALLAGRASHRPPCTFYDQSALRVNLWAIWKRNQIIESLMISFLVEMLNILPHSPAEGLLTEEYHVVDTLALYG